MKKINNLAKTHKKYLTKLKLNNQTANINEPGARSLGQTQYPTGVPVKPRHRKFFGM